MSSDELQILVIPIIAGIPDTMIGQWWTALAGLAILVFLRPHPRRG